MAYDTAFFEAYRKYLTEQTVRNNHDRVFRDWFKQLSPHHLSVVDLGCGTGEFYQHGHSTDYVGIDREPRIIDEAWYPHAAVKTIAADYLDVSAWKPQLPFKPNCFVSLFSIEPVLRPGCRYDLYTSLFGELPSLQFGMAAGFYYDDKTGEETVGETGGIVSYQTIEPLGMFNVPGVDEERLVLRTPSAMFGDHVVEVWKFFTRR
jgi:SAM-dependent methyltransferase